MKLKNLDNEIKKRRLIASYYLENIKNENIFLPKGFFENNHVWHLFVIRTEKRDELKTYLEINGVNTIIHYPIPPHQQMAFKEWSGDIYKISEKIHSTVLSLPLSSVQCIEDTIKIVDLINKFE